MRESGSAGLVKLGHVAIDGTKLQAMSYGRMGDAEKKLTHNILTLFRSGRTLATT